MATVPPTSTVPDADRDLTRQQARIGLVLLMLAGLALRCINLDGKSLWSDELATIATATGHLVDPAAWAYLGGQFDPAHPSTAGAYLQQFTQYAPLCPLSQVWSVLKTNVHPPLFFSLMHYWVGLTGIAAQTLRLPAVLFSTLCIPALYRVVRRVHPRCLALATAGVFALSGYQVAHAQDARPYSLATLALLILAWQFIRLAQKAPQSTKSWSKIAISGVGIGLVLVLGLGTQYLFGVSAAVLALGLVWAVWRPSPSPPTGAAQSFYSRLLPLLAVGLVAVATLALCSLPWLPYLAAQKAFLAHAGHYTHGLWNPIQLPEKLFRVLCDVIAPQSSEIRLWIGALIASLVLLRFRKTTALARQGSPHPIGAYWPTLWLVGLVLAQMGLDMIQQSHTLVIRRYVLLAAPALYWLIVVGGLYVYQRTQWLGATLAILLAGLLGVNTTNVIQGRVFHSDDFKTAAQVINQHARPSDLVLVHRSGAMTLGMAYYLAKQTPLWGTSSGNSSFHKPFRANPKVWLVWTHASLNEQQQALQNLAQNGRTCRPTSAKLHGISLHDCTIGRSFTSNYPNFNQGR
jgi:uncharacterized membrane protein